MSEVVLGIDIGGSHLTGALVLQDSGELVPTSYIRTRVNSTGSVEEIIDTWAASINSIYEKHHVAEKRIGLAMPGPFDYENGISFITGLNKYESFYQLNVKKLLANKLNIDSSNILMMNDAACFLLGEMMYGAGKGHHHAIGITLGTGTGTATHHCGITNNAELGITRFKERIVDDYFSTRWFVNRYEDLSGIKTRDVKELAGYYEKDPCIRDIFTEFTENFASFLRGFIQVEDPNVIVLGGNIMHCAQLFQEELITKLNSAGIHIPIVKAHHGEKAAIMGASKLFEIRSV